MLGVAFAVPLASCAVTEPLTITSTGGESGLARGVAVALNMPDDPSSQRGRFAEALGEAMAARSVQIADDAPLLADISIARGDASGGVINGPGNPATSEQDWIATPRRDRRFDKCEAERLRATLVLYDRASGAIAYRGSGTATQCGFADADIAAMAQGLVDDAMTRSGERSGVQGAP